MAGPVAGSRAQDAPRTRAWPPQLPTRALPARRGSPRCRRPGSRRSARSPWRRAIRTTRPAQHCSASRTARSATPRSSWDVALAAARAGPHSPPGYRRPAATAAATPQTAPPDGSWRERSGEHAAGGGGAHEKAERRLGTPGLATGPRSGQDLSRRVSTFSEGYLVAAPPGDQRQERKGTNAEHAWRLLCFRSCLIRLYS